MKKRIMLFLMLGVLGKITFAVVPADLSKLSVNSKNNDTALPNENKNNYPWIGDFLPRPGEKKPSFQALNISSTPPGPPADVFAMNEGLAVVLSTWSVPVDVGSGVEFYVFGVGKSTGTADIRWWQVCNGRSASFCPLEYGLKEGDTVYINVEAANAGGNSEPRASNPVILRNWHVGSPDNNIKISYSTYGYDKDGATLVQGWTPEQIARFEYFTSRMIPVIKELYGPPAFNLNITFVRNLWYSGSNMYSPQFNEIYMDDSFNPRLLTHEMIHAFRDDVILASNQNWQYDSTLSGFEEAFAHQVSYDCMNRYIQLYPYDLYVDTNAQYGSGNEWDYDFQNIEELETTDFWSDTSGMGFPWLRYEMAGAAMHKIHMEKPDFYKLFNQEWYSRINSDASFRSSRQAIIDIINTIVPKIEGQDTPNWIEKQHIFKCKIKPGRKIFVRTQHYPSWKYYIIYQNIHYYETFDCGNDWAYWDGSKYVYYNLNGSTGTAVLYDSDNNIVWQQDIQTKPVDNVPVIYKYGDVVKNLINMDNSQDYPADTYIGGLHKLGLYRMVIKFGNTTKTTFRVEGDPLTNCTGVWGGVIGAQDGTIYINHEGYPDEPGIPVVNNVFYSTRSWAGVHNSRLNTTDTIPGKLSIKYINKNGKEFNTGQNIDLGSSNGNHIFLFDFTEVPVSFVHDGGAWTNDNTRLYAVWFATAPESGIVEYRYAVGTEVNGTNIAGWTSTGISTGVTHVFSAPNLLQHNTTYYFSILARTGDGRYLNVGCSDGICVDLTAPLPPSVVNDGLKTDEDIVFSTVQLSASWNQGIDAESGIKGYWYAVGTASGSDDVKNWAYAGNISSITVGSLNISKGNTYYFSIKSENNAGSLSAAVSSDGNFVFPDELDHYEVLVPSNIVVGAGFSMSVTAKNYLNNTIESYSGSINISAVLAGNESVPGNGMLNVTHADISAGTAVINHQSYNVPEDIKIKIRDNEVKTGISCRIGVTDTSGTISGIINNKNLEALQGVSVSLFREGALKAQTTTDASGSYSIKIATGIYDLCAEKYKYQAKITGGCIVYSGSTTRIDVQLDASTKTFSIKGFIKENDDKAVSGLTVNLSGPVEISTVTAEDGYYQFLELAPYTDYRIEPEGTNYFFMPSSRSCINLENDCQRQDFTCLAKSIAGSHGENISSEIFREIDEHECCTLAINDISSQINKTAIEIPSGAVSTHTIIIIGKVSNVPVLPQGSRVQGAVVDFRMVGGSLDFAYPVTIKLPYSVNVTDPALLRVYSFVNNTNWEEITGKTIDRVNRLVIFHVTHLSYYALAFTAEATLDELKVYPNPCMAGGGHTQVIFSNLTKSASIRIYSIAGELIKTLDESDGDGFAVWYMDNNQGKKVSSGVYIYVVTENSGRRKSGKLAIVR